jgi:hypothetical protein
MLNSLILHVAESAERLKLIWTGYGPGEQWTPPPYTVDPALLQQAANAVRTHLHEIGRLPQPPDAMVFRSLLQKLAERGHDLYLQLMPDPDPADGLPAEIQQRIEEALIAAADHPPELKVILGTDKLFVPWGLVFAGGAGNLPAVPSLSFSDMNGFWIACSRISVIYGGSNSLPRERKERFAKLYALDEALFTAARGTLDQGCAARLDELLKDEPPPTTDWESFEDAWTSVCDESDSVLYLFGHSDGQRIRLSSQGENDPKYELLSAGFRRFRKKARGSASIFVLNGCRTSAPSPATPAEPLSANFLKETRQAGYYGFIGTEAEVPNTFACRYGTELLWLLCKQGKSVGAAVDELLCRDEFFPHNILYTCYADREFFFSQVKRGANYDG